MKPQFMREAMDNGNGLDSSHESRIQNVEKILSDHGADIKSLSVQVEIGNRVIVEKLDNVAILVKEHIEKDEDFQLKVTNRLVKAEVTLTQREKWSRVGRRVLTSLSIAAGGGLIGLIFEFVKNHMGK